jgi:SPP1 family predicted phage head-tail adaptor
MKAGTLRHLLTIEQSSAKRDGHGQNIPSWAELENVWGSINPLKGQQLALSQANTITATATHMVIIRYFEGLLISKHRLRYDESGTKPRYFTINDMLDPDERQRELHLTVTEVRG